MIALIALTIACVLLAFGPVLQLRPGQPFFASSIPLPGKIWLQFSAIRWPMRIYMYAGLCLALLASLGASKLLNTGRSVWRILAWTVIMALVFVEFRPARWFAQRSLSIGDPAEMSDAYAFLGRESNRGGVVELPSRMDSGLNTPFATRYVYGASSHMRGVVAFHGSLYPPVLESLRVASHDLPRPEAIQVMATHGVSRLVIHKDLMSADSVHMIAGELRSQGFPIVFDARGSTVFSLIR